MKLGAFQISEKLAVGGMGEVWSGTHAGSGQQVVAKVLTDAGARHPQFVELFVLEVQATARLEHPNVISVFDFGTLPAEAADLGLTPGSPYYVMEWVSGGSLVGQPWNYNALRNALLGILSGLAHSHARGILHLDMKPGNVLWSAERAGLPRIVVTDFGLARANEYIEGLDDITESLNSNASGTPAYMSPEQFMGAFRDFVPATDLYAVGIMAYEFVAGRLPFDADNMIQIAQLQLKEPLPELEPRFAVPQQFDSWVERLTRKAPGERFASAADAARALRQLGDVAFSEIAHSADIVEADTLDSSDAPTLVTSTPGVYSDSVSLPAVSDDAAIPETWRDVSERWLTTRWMPPGRDIVKWRRPSFVAREAERDLLWQALRAVATQRQARAIVLRGGLGTGKTRLAEWLLELFRLGGYGRTAVAYHEPSHTGAHGLGGMLSDYYRCLGLRPDAARKRLESRLSEHELDDNELDALTALIAETTGDDAIRSLNLPRLQIGKRALLREASDGPMIVLLDDLQWGPEACELMTELAGADETPLLMIGTLRDDDPAAAFDISTPLAEDPFIDIVAIENLLPGDALKLAKEALAVTGEVARIVATSTNGNPLQATELVKHWLQNGELRCEEHAYVLTTDSPTMPDDLASLWSRSIEAMVARLKEPRLLSDDRIAIPASEETIWTRLEIAAALGVRVSKREWDAGCKASGAAPVFGLIDELVQIGFCSTTDEGFQFEHGLLRQSLIDRSRDAGRWEELNLSVARALESLHDPSTRGLLGRLAGHYLVAGALDHAERLVADALHRQALFGYSTAQELARAYDILVRRGFDFEDPRWIDIWMMRGELLAMSTVETEHERGMELLERALEHAQSGDDPVKLGQALRFHGWCQVFDGDMDLGLRELEESLELLTGHFEESLSATFLSLVHFYASNFEEVRETALRGLRTAKSPIQEFYGHQMLSYVAEDYEEALEHLARCYAIANAYQLPDAVYSTLWGLGDAHFAAGEYARAAESYRKYVDLCLFTGRNDRFAVLAPESLGRSLALAGRHGDALPHLLEVHQSMVRGEHATGAEPADAILFCAVMLGDSALAESVFEEALRPPPPNRVEHVVPVIEALLEELQPTDPMRLRMLDSLQADPRWQNSNLAEAT